MMPKAKGDPYFISCRQGAEEAARETGVDLIWDGPTELDPARQNEVVEAWITRGVNVVAVSVENQAAMSTVLRKARGRGIKVLTWDADSEPDARDFLINQATPQGIGETLTDEAARLLGGSGDFAIVTASLSAANQNQWIAVIKARLAEKYPNLHLVAIRPSDGDRDRAFAETQTILKVYPKVRLIMGIAAPAVPGAAEAVRQSGRKDVVVTGLSLPNMCKPYVHDGTIGSVVLWNTRDLGYLTVRAAAALAGGTLSRGAVVVPGRPPRHARGLGRPGAAGPAVRLHQRKHRPVRFLGQMLNIATAVVAAVLAAAGASPDRKPDALHRFFDLQRRWSKRATATSKTVLASPPPTSGSTSRRSRAPSSSTRRAATRCRRCSARATASPPAGTRPAWAPANRRGTSGCAVSGLRAVPVDGLELSAGSFDVVRGETTEIMSYDNDAYMQGYRVSVKRPAQAFFDEISVTAGYLGDVSQPNVFERFKWMDNHNYTQALVAKRVGKMFAASVDWTSVDHVDTVREGVRIGAKDLIPRVIDDVRVQAYQRTDSPTGTGMSVEAERFFSKRAMAYGGYAHVDRNKGSSTATATASVTACTAADRSTSCPN